jgi:hypothetical protein
MPYYLLAIKYYLAKRSVRRFRCLNCSLEELMLITTIYNNNLPILVSGRKIISSQIEQFLIFSSPSVFHQDMLLSTGTKISDEKHDVMVKCLLKGELNSEDVTSEFLNVKVP